jgi:hypothetical protein
MIFTARSASPALLWASIAVTVVAGGAVLSADPAYAFKPAYTTKNRFGNYYEVSPNSSFGFFFDVTQDLPIDGLGFAPQEGWPGGTSSYDVTLWGFENGGNSYSDYTQLRTVKFTPGNSYTILDNYCWQSIVPIILPESYNTDAGNLRGYVIAAIGNFKQQPGNVQFEVATPTIDPNFNFGRNGYNDSTDPAGNFPSGFFPIPIYDGGVGYTGFFNPNLSYVPGPAPILGVASALGIARKLRQRIKSAKQ